MNIIQGGHSAAQTPGRQGARVDRIVWHHIGGSGTVAGALNWVTRPGATESYHYLVAEDGRIFRVVSEQNTSWHAGNWAMNLRSIGVAHPPNGGGEPTRRASIALARDICRRYGIAADGGHILPHRAVQATACPGGLPVPEWIAQVAAQAMEDDMYGDADRNRDNHTFNMAAWTWSAVQNQDHMLRGPADALLYWGDQLHYYLTDTRGQVVQLQWAPGFTQWAVHVLSPAGSARPGSRCSANIYTNQAHVFCESADGNGAVHCWWSEAQWWRERLGPQGATEKASVRVDSPNMPEATPLASVDTASPPV